MIRVWRESNGGNKLIMNSYDRLLWIQYRPFAFHQRRQFLTRWRNDVSTVELNIPNWNQTHNYLYVDTEIVYHEIHTEKKHKLWVWNMMCVSALAECLCPVLVSVWLPLIGKSILERLAANLVSIAARDNSVYGLPQMLVRMLSASQKKLT